MQSTRSLFLTNLLHSTIRNTPGGIPAAIDDSITTEVMVPVVVVIVVVVEMLTVRVEADAIADLKTGVVNCFCLAYPRKI